MKPNLRLLIVASTLGVSLIATGSLSSQPAVGTPLSEAFVGVTTDGSVLPNLFPIAVTGVSTQPIRVATERFIEALTEDQRTRTLYEADDLEWRTWHNIHRAPRQGVSFGEMTDRQRELAFDLFNASLSASGVEKTRSVMVLNEHLAELVSKHDEYGDEYYYLTFMGEPSADQPWGWQLDGHHLVINYFVLGDQVVMTPTFMGSEPVIGTGKYAGVEIMQPEQDKGLAFMRSLSPEHQAKATLATDKTGGNALGQAYNDNLVLDYAGLQIRDLEAAQTDLLMEVVKEFIFNLREAHAAIWLEAVAEHLEQTWFAWIGGTTDDSVFYYRIHSPVILIEFDHQGPVAFRTGSRAPTRNHVHSVVRTPNGNDYGKDLLRQHYEAHANDPNHTH